MLALLSWYSEELPESSKETNNSLQISSTVLTVELAYSQGTWLLPSKPLLSGGDGGR